MKQIVALLVFFVGWCAWKINWIGLQYDEVLFANAARGVVNDSFLHSRIWKFPLMLMPYIGAIKAYLYFVILKIFPVGVVTIRLPMILLAAVSLGITFWWLGRMFNQQIAKLACLLIALSPVFQQMMMFDVGPNAGEYFFKVSSLCAWFYFWNNKSKKFIFGLTTCLILGMYNKLNFVWFVNSFLVGIFLFFFDFKKVNKKIILALLVPLVGFGAYFLMAGYLREINLFSVERWSWVLKMVADLVEETVFLKYLGVTITSQLGRYYCYLVMGVIFLGLFLSWKQKKFFKEMLFLIVNLSLIFVQIVLTTRANAPWHVFMLVPFFQVLLAASVYLMGKRGWLVLGLVISYLCLRQYNYYFGSENKVDNQMWTKNIYSLVEYTRKTNNKYIILDWGIGNQLALFDPVKKKYMDSWANFQVDNKEINDYMYREYFLNRDYRYIGYASPDKNSPKGKDNFLFLVKLYKMKATLVKSGYYEIYEVSR